MTPEAWPHWSIGNIAVRVHRSITVHAHISWWQLPSFNWVSMDTSATLGRSFHVRNALHIVLLFVCLFIYAFWGLGQTVLIETNSHSVFVNAEPCSWGGVIYSLVFELPHLSHVRPTARSVSDTIREAILFTLASIKLLSPGGCWRADGEGDDETF